jgi:hypothetical protein
MKSLTFNVLNMDLLCDEIYITEFNFQTIQKLRNEFPGIDTVICIAVTKNIFLISSSSGFPMLLLLKDVALLMNCFICFLFEHD